MGTFFNFLLLLLNSLMFMHLLLWRVKVAFCIYFGKAFVKIYLVYINIREFATNIHYFRILLMRLILCFKFKKALIICFGFISILLVNFWIFINWIMEIFSAILIHILIRIVLFLFLFVCLFFFYYFNKIFTIF